MPTSAPLAINEVSGIQKISVQALDTIISFREVPPTIEAEKGTGPFLSQQMDLSPGYTGSCEAIVSGAVQVGPSLARRAGVKNPGVTGSFPPCSMKSG